MRNPKNCKRTKHLYEENKVEGYDYVFCPVTGHRKIQLKRTYIENVLGMSVEEFKRRFPNQKMECDSRAVIIRATQQSIDPETGLTKYEKGQITARKTRARIDEDGTSINSRKGNKTKESHLSRVDENGLNGYQRIAKVARPKQIVTLAKQGRAIQPDSRYQWESYRWFCIWWSNQFRSVIMKDLPTGRAGTTNAYHLDHIYSIFDGFINNVSPFLISCVGNLRATPWETNVRKNRSSSCSFEYLLSNGGYTEEQSLKEYRDFIEICGEKNLLSSAALLEEYRKRKDDTKVYSKPRL